MMVRGMVAQVSSELIEATIKNIVARFGGDFRIQAPMMIVGHPCGEYEACRHRQQEEEEGLERTPCRQTCEQKYGHSRPGEEYPLVFGMLLTYLVSAIVGGQRDRCAVGQHTHRLAIFFLPSALVFRLVEEIQMVTEVVVKHPEIGRDAGMQSQQLLIEPVEPSRPECMHVLMVVVPCTDDALRNQQGEPIPGEEPGAVQEKIGGKIEQAD